MDAHRRTGLAGLLHRIERHRHDDVVARFRMPVGEPVGFEIGAVRRYGEGEISGGQHGVSHTPV